MRCLLALVLLCGTTVAVAEDAEVRVFCPAIAFDDYDERGSNGPDGPHSVVLMMVDKVQASPGVQKNRSGDTSRRSRDDKTIQLTVERVLFGSPPAKTIAVTSGHGGSVPADADKVSYIYGLTSSRDGAEIRYSLDGYYSSDRTYSLKQEREAQALAQARLDLLVLSSYAIFLGRPAEGGKGANPNRALVERVLHGPLKSGEHVTVGPDERNSIPLSGDGPFMYFIARQNRHGDRAPTYDVATRWSAEPVDTVLEALKRRGEYPIREKVDEYGRVTRHQEILFLGSRAETIEMLGSPEKPIEILAARRLIHDGDAALPEVVAAVEQGIWRAKVEIDAARRQSNLIRLLGILENHRTDGHVVRLIDEILTKAEKGATFPAPRASDPSTPGGARRYSTGIGGSHSLGWLLRTLDEPDAARLFGERLLKLRDLAAYGWKDEAQSVIDASHIEDHLALAKVESRSKELKRVRWQAGFDGHGLDHYQIAFSPDGKWFAAVDGTGRVWNTADWSIAGEFKQPASVNAIAFSSDGESLFVASGGAIAILDRWDWRSAKVLQRYPGHDHAVDAIQLSRDDKSFLTSVGYEGTTILFNAESGEVIERWPGEAWYELKLRSDARRFLARRGKNWFAGGTREKDRKQLPFASLDVAWAGDGVWSLEENTAAEPLVKAKRNPGDAPDLLEENPFDDVFDRGNPRRPSVLRQRRLDDKGTVVFERPLSFDASKLYVAEESGSVVVLNDQQVELFTAPGWKSAAAWKFPAVPREGLARFDRRKRHYQISADGKWLAVGEEYAFPQLFETRSGRKLTLGKGHSNQIVGINFADDGKLRTRDADGVVLRWDPANGQQLKAMEGDVAETPSAADPWDRRGDDTFVAEDGKTWWFVGQGGGAYGWYESFEIRVIEKGVNRPESQFDDTPRKGITTLGVIDPKWRQYELLGLVPGGKYLHVGTQIFSRRDLKPVSAVNIAGHIDQIMFSGDGLRYALIASERESRPSALGYGVTVEHEVSQRLRIHDTRTGEMLFATPTANHVRLVAFSPDSKRLAAVNDRQGIEVWTLDR